VSSLGVLACLLTGVGAAGSSAESATSAASSPNQRTIEIIVTGPEDARNQMVATLQPLLPMAPDLRWVTQASLPAQETPSPSSEDGVAHIWIDVSNLTQVRVYLPEKTKGEVGVRTLESTGSSAEDVDPMAREAVAQIVKASVLALREMPGEAAPPVVVETSAVSSRPDAHLHDGLYVGVQSGFGYLRTSESYGGGSDVFSGVGATLQAAVGEAIVGRVILYGQVVMTAVRNADWTSNAGPVLDNGPYESGRDLTLLGVGPGVMYDLPSNFHASGSLLLSKLWFLDANTDLPPPDTQWGIGGAVAIGRDWWLSRDWGLGVAAQFNDAVMAHHLVIHRTKTPEPISPLVNVMSFGLLVSATYN
jgi:hypothetical protein